MSSDLPVLTHESRTIGGLRWLSRHFGPWTILFIALVIIPAMHITGHMSTKRINELGYYMALAIVAVGLDLIWGYVGILCLCMALFFGVGVYGMAMHLALHGSQEGGLPRSLHEVTSAVDTPELPWHWEPFYNISATLLLGFLLSGLLAIMIGYFGFRSRVRGVYFAVLTQALALAGWVTFRNTEIKLGGTTGIRNFLKVAGFDVNNESTLLGLYIVTLLTLVAVFFLCRWIVTTHFGRVLIAIRDNENRLRFSGYSPHHFKLVAFVLAAMIASLGGMLYTPQKGSINPAMVTVEKSILVVIWVAVGGRGTLSGAILGAMLIQLLENFLTSQHELLWVLSWMVSEETYRENFRQIMWHGEYWQYVLGGLFIGVVLFFPDGLISIWHKWVSTDSSPDSLDNVGQSRDSGQADIGQQEKSDSALLQRRLKRITLSQRKVTSESQLDSPLLRIENIKVFFDGFKALDIESFSVPHYALNVIIGPNGAGKTTLCDVVSGKTRPTQGRIIFAGQDITTIPEIDIARMGVGRKFQTPTVFNSLTVNENMELSLPGRERLARNFRVRATLDEQNCIQSILERVRLSDEVDKQVKYLSHGQRQWLEISMLILHSPQLLLVDEPAAGLTDEETALTAELLLELKDEHSVIVIEHDMEFVRLLNSNVTVLNEGLIMAQGTMEEVQSNPEVIEAYLGR